MNLKLDDNGDLVINKGAGRLSGIAYVAQLISNRLKTIKGEWELDRNDGLPWFTDMLKYNPDMSYIYTLILNAITNTYGVTSVDFLQLNRLPNRTLSVSFRVTSKYGLIDNTVEV